VTPAEVAGRLREAGIAAAPDDITLEERDDRWLARLGDGRLAWFPANPRGAERLGRERRMLALLAARCGFRVPRVLFESAEGWDVRAPVPGSGDLWALYRRVTADPALAGRIGAEIGAILAEQHTRIGADDVSNWLPNLPDWPQPTAQLRTDLPHVIDDTALIATINRVLDDYDAVEVTAADKVPVHGDLGLHNMAIDAATGRVEGVFDYDGASWSDRHHDFRYLLFDEGAETMLEAALAIYEPTVGRRLNRERIHLYNAACAIGFLAYRRGVPADERWCGRTLEEDLRWVRGAIGRI